MKYGQLHGHWYVRKLNAVYSNHVACSAHWQIAGANGVAAGSSLAWSARANWQIKAPISIAASTALDNDFYWTFENNFQHTCVLYKPCIYFHTSHIPCSCLRVRSTLDKYNNWCKASKLIAPALTTIWSQIFKMGSWKKNSNAKLLIVLLVFYYFHNYHFDQ